jgi:prevent-host-death family protein
VDEQWFEGLRELTHRTAAIARRVRAGETILVTDHETPVMRLIPAAPADEAMARLSAADLLIPATNPGYLPEPVNTGRWTGEDAAATVSEIRQDRI